MAKAIRRLVPDQEVIHIVELGLQDLPDVDLCKRWKNEFTVWITRYEDFWISAPDSWAIVWVSCHNPKLAFLNHSVSRVIAENLIEMKPTLRFLITEDLATFI